MQETTGARLRRLREVKGLTRYRLAKVSGVAESYIYRIENDEIKNPRRDTLQKLAHGLNITLTELIGETKPHEVWSLVEQSLKAYVPVFAGVDDMEPIDFVACTRAKVPMHSVRGYRLEGLSLEPYVREGDVIIVDSKLPPINGDLVLITTNAQPPEIGIAQYFEEGEHCWLSDKMGIHELDEMKVQGTITECVHRFRQ